MEKTIIIPSDEEDFNEELISLQVFYHEDQKAYLFMKQEKLQIKSWNSDSCKAKTTAKVKEYHHNDVWIKTIIEILGVVVRVCI